MEQQVSSDHIKVSNETLADRPSRLEMVQGVMAALAAGEVVDPETINPRTHCPELVTYLHQHRKRNGSLSQL
ncbi:MAG TPA: hypothetical protein VH144_02040 [Candidatus Saccharimonadales bacterium]|nr:hypothetical protein [Candidatus Saccharimonadales bacterium]